MACLNRSGFWDWSGSVGELELGLEVGMDCWAWNRPGEVGVP